MIKSNIVKIKFVSWQLVCLFLIVVGISSLKAEPNDSVKRFLEIEARSFERITANQQFNDLALLVYDNLEKFEGNVTDVEFSETIDSEFFEDVNLIGLTKIGSSFLDSIGFKIKIRRASQGTVLLSRFPAKGDELMDGETVELRINIYPDKSISVKRKGY